MKTRNHENILQILKQIEGPVKINYQIKQITGISEELIYFHINKLEVLLHEKKEIHSVYTLSDLYSLYRCLEFILDDLGIDEFETVTGEDIFTFGYPLLSYIKKLL